MRQESLLYIACLFRLYYKLQTFCLQKVNDAFKHVIFNGRWRLSGITFSIVSVLQRRSFKRVITSSICGISTLLMFQTPSCNRIYLPANGLIGLCNILPCVSPRRNSITRPKAVGFNKANVVTPELNTSKYQIRNGSQEDFVHSYILDTETWLNNTFISNINFKFLKA